MGESPSLAGPVETPSCLTAGSTMKLTILSFLAALLALTTSAPQGQGRSQNSPNTRFFTGNTAIDSAAAGAALGLATQYIGNQIFNPCRRNNNRNRNRNTSTRFGNGAIGNGIHGFLGGYIGGQLVNNAAGNPCGK